MFFLVDSFWYGGCFLRMSWQCWKHFLPFRFLWASLLFVVCCWTRPGVDRTVPLPVSILIAPPAFVVIRHPRPLLLLWRLIIWVESWWATSATSSLILSSSLYWFSTSLVRSVVATLLPRSGLPLGLLRFVISSRLGYIHVDLWGQQSEQDFLTPGWVLQLPHVLVLVLKLELELSLCVPQLELRHLFTSCLAWSSCSFISKTHLLLINFTGVATSWFVFFFPIFPTLIAPTVQYTILWAG